MPPKSLIIFFVTNEDVRKLDFTLDSVFADVFPHFDRIVFEEGVLLNFKLFRESLKGKNKSFVNKDSIVGGDSSKISVINGNALQLADKIMSIFERPKEVRVEELMAGYKLGESVVRTALCFFDLSVFYQNLGIQFTQLTQLEAFLSRICQKNICEGVKVRLVADNDLQFTYNSVFEVLIENIKKYSYSFNLLNYEISSSDFKKFINANREEGGNRNQQSQGREDFLFNKPKIVNQEMQLQQGKKRLVIFLTDEKEEESYLYKFFTGVYDDVVSCFNLFMFETKRNADLFKFYKNKGKSFSDKMIDLDDYCQSLCYYDLTVARRCKIKKIFSELEGGGDFRHVDSILAFFNLNNDYEFVRGLEYKKLEQFLSILDQNAKNRENVEISLAISENIERKCDSSYCLDKLKEAYSLGWDMSFVNFMEFNDIGDFYKRSLPREDEVEKGLSRIEEQKSQFHKGSFPRGSYNQYEFQQKEKCLTIFLVDVKQSGECSCLDNFFTEYFFDIFPRFDKFMFETEELRNRLPLLYKKLEETHIRNSRLDINNEDLYSETKGCMGRVSEMFLKLDDSLEHRPVNSGLVFFDLNSCGKSSKKENVQEFLKMFSMSKQSDPARENIKSNQILSLLPPDFIKIQLNINLSKRGKISKKYSVKKLSRHEHSPDCFTSTKKIVKHFSFC